MERSAVFLASKSGNETFTRVRRPGTLTAVDLKRFEYITSELDEFNAYNFSLANAKTDRENC